MVEQRGDLRWSVMPLPFDHHVMLRLTAGKGLAMYVRNAFS